MIIAGLVITYNPDKNAFSEVVENLISQLDMLVIVDNGSDNSDYIKSFSSNKKINVIPLLENFGIAKATNIGLEEIYKQNYNFCLISDQDTIYPVDYIENFKTYRINNNDSDIAAFSPIFFDVNSNEYKPLYILKNNKILKVKHNGLPQTVFQAIASGLIVDMNKYNLIGGMNENLFIDYVDFEWCWKVNYLGYKILCLPQLQIKHCLGEGVVSVGNKKISEHSSLRYYYITRNTFYLSLHTTYLSKIVKIQLFLKACLFPMGYAILCKPHLKNFIFTHKGMIDGIIGKLGKYSIR